MTVAIGVVGRAGDMDGRVGTAGRTGAAAVDLSAPRTDRVESLSLLPFPPWKKSLLLKLLLMKVDGKPREIMATTRFIPLLLQVNVAFWEYINSKNSNFFHKE